MDMMLDMLIAGSGAYLVYVAIIMKRDGKIPAGVLVNKNADLSKAKDIPGFIKYMFGKTVVIGLCAVLSGAVGIINNRFGGLGMVQLAMTVVFLIAVVSYGYFTMKAQKKYLGL